MKLDENKTYSRKDNILYEEGVPIVKITFSKFIDIEKLRPEGVKYMERYMNAYPDYYEKIKPTEEQLTLF